MTACVDYAQLFETEIRPRRRLDRRVRKVAAYALLGGLFLIRPRLALQILRDRPDCRAGAAR